MGLNVILDKSVVFGLNNAEADSLDRYFFQIVPPILTNEILADLAKEAETPTIKDKIANHSYRISGNRGLTINYIEILWHSLMGEEIPMEGKFVSAGQRIIPLEDGSFATTVETPLQDETIFRWEAKDFTAQEKVWVTDWRKRVEKPLNPKLFINIITEAGLPFEVPEDEKELVETVDSLLQERKLQGKLLPLFSREHNLPLSFQKKVFNRWIKERKPMIKDFAPYAFFCARVDFIWALGLTNPKLFKSDKNDRKDLNYCYYLPHCEIFSSKDKKHKKLVPFLLRSDQSFVDGEELKQDLRRLSEEWNNLSQEEKVHIYSERRSAPPEDKSSIVFKLWKKHRGKIIPSLPLEILQVKLVDSTLPEDEQVPTTLEEILKTKMREIKAAKRMPVTPEKLKNISGKNDEAIAVVRTTKVSKDRLLRMHPNLKPEDLIKNS